MTSEKAKKMLKAKLECLKRETSGTDIDCNYRNCDECNLCYEQGNMGEQKEAFEIVIKALEQQPCEDCVSREDVKSEMIKYGFLAPDMTVTEFVEYLPPVKPQRPKGKWIDEDTEQGVLGFQYKRKRCSKCGWSHSLLIPKDYCPNCGAKMEG